MDGSTKLSLSILDKYHEIIKLANGQDIVVREDQTHQLKFLSS